MKTLFISTASALAVSLGAVGAAQADHSLSSNLGGGFLDILADDEAGAWTNMAVNTENIDGSVTVHGGVVGVNIDTTHNWEVQPDIIEAHQFSQTQDFEAVEVNVGDIDTTAIGALQEGDIASASIESEESTSFAANVHSASSAAGAKTEAAAEFDAAVNFEAFSSLSGPVTNVTSSNLAYNNAEIDASVTLGSLVNADSISTTAAGAISSGNISVGFDGSALD